MDYNKIILTAFESTSEKMIKVKPETVSKGEEKSPIKAEEVAIIIGLAGQISGQIIYCLSEETVFNITSKMIRQATNELDELTISAITEFINVLSGNATIELVEAGSKKLGMSPPSIIMGRGMRISTKIEPINIFKLNYEEIGEMTVYIALKERK